VGTANKGSSASTGTSPLAGLKWYVDPNSNAAEQAAAWRPTRPADAAQMDKIAAQSQAYWFGNWNSDVASAADQATLTTRPSL
jgi:hypothetical protein